MVCFLIVKKVLFLCSIKYQNNQITKYVLNNISVSDHAYKINICLFYRRGERGSEIETLIK